jgi:hypothetical protein
MISSLPLLYVDTPRFPMKKTGEYNIAEEIAKWQWLDWRDFRHEPLTNPEAGKD